MKLHERRSVFKAARQRLQFDVSQIRLMGSSFFFFLPCDRSDRSNRLPSKNLSFRVRHLFPAGACRTELEDN